MRVISGQTPAGELNQNPLTFQAAQPSTCSRSNILINYTDNIVDGGR